MNRTEKQELIDELHKEFQASPHAVLVDFRGLSVPAVTEFRPGDRVALCMERSVDLLVAVAGDHEDFVDRVLHPGVSRAGAPSSRMTITSKSPVRPCGAAPGFLDSERAGQY